MENFKATKREISTSGAINKLRAQGFIPAILYGGTKKNLPISINKNQLKDIVRTEAFMSSVLDLDIDGDNEKVIPRDMHLDPLSNEPLHIDFMRVIKGETIIIEIPVRFVNNEKSPGLKKGGVLNIVRRKVKLKCPAETIPKEIVIDLEGTEIGTSIKISFVKLPDNVFPTITDRDFVIATVASPTVVVEPEKPATETEETEASAEGEGETPVDGKEVKADTKGAKPNDDKEKPAPGKQDKGKDTK
ncbi:MAG: 50S ribosomal protein L25/general stress protein Ctc [Candidatus Pelagibacter sp. TMED64]|nr:50S ribosomal protein L25 [Candidatus Pelagibacter sp.]OUU65363.1 MAG: 50S ribosomal protein L25/general stress protein Ctc [Candidatus Pelagibacter sp. TMED64]|tara:strand:- start:2665 stop:3402 length:738 start_codon:yes stop_codon:yes gene_type:complete